MCHGRRFGEAVTFDQPAPGDLTELDLHIHWQGRGAADARLDRAQVIFGHVRVIDDADVHRRYTGIERSTLFLDGLHDVFGRTGIGQDRQHAARLDREAHRHRHAVDAVSYTHLTLPTNRE